MDDYAVIGGIAAAPFRLVPSETWGDAFLVPADAELLIEGEIPANVREVEGPFGEFTGYYGPQRVRPVIDVTAITHRRDAILQHAFVGPPRQLDSRRHSEGRHGLQHGQGHRPHGESRALRAVRELPVQLLHLHRQEGPGETKQAALAAFGAVDFVKNIIVVDADIDPFNEQEVMFAVATRTQARRPWTSSRT